jgi:transcriptional regulator with XRE-family HTH domain
MDILLGEKIKKVRNFKGFSQQMMAEKMNISQRAYSSIENDETKIDLERLSQISTALEIDPIELLTFDEKMVFNNCTQSGNMYSPVFNNGSEIERELYEKHIKRLEEEVAFLRSILKTNS